jgi:hypothetical protein
VRRLGQLGLLVQAARELQRTAADVEHEQATGTPAEPAHGQEREPRFVGTGQQLQVDACLPAYAIKNSHAVPGVPQCRRREREQVVTPSRAGRSVGDRDGLDQRVRSTAPTLSGAAASMMKSSTIDLNSW